MFVLNLDREYTWPVEFSIPVDGGVFENVSFSAKFKMISQSEIDALAKDAELSNDEVVRRVLVGWDDTLTGKDGNPIPFNKTSVKDLLNWPGLSNAIVTAFFESVSGGLKRKN